MNIEDIFPDVEYVPKIVLPQIPDAIERALDVGATPPFEYLGAGASSVVLSDTRGIAFKIARLMKPFLVSMLFDEFEWLTTAATINRVRPFVAQTRAFYPDQGIIEREHVVFDDDAWGRRRSGKSLYDLQLEICEQMEKLEDWGCPEFKEDSWVFASRGPVLVDAGHSHRIGRRLLDYTNDVLAGKVPWETDSPSDFAFYLRREVQEGALAEQQVAATMARLKAKGG